MASQHLKHLWICQTCSFLIPAGHLLTVESTDAELISRVSPYSPYISAKWSYKNYILNSYVVLMLFLFHCLPVHPQVLFQVPSSFVAAGSNKLAPEQGPDTKRFPEVTLSFQSFAEKWKRTLSCMISNYRI